LVSSTNWHENGQKSGENGAGRSVSWYENGQMQRENVYKDVSRPLLPTKETEWYERGQMRSLCTRKDGTHHGVWTQWYESGQKSHEANYKDGRETRQTQWHSNGQMSHQIVYKSPSRRLYQKSWNEKGELISEERW
jgi:antitoxin component YwqK of YwqJK toxin-antitoxin module